jgi:hypothetical protein
MNRTRLGFIAIGVCVVLGLLAGFSSDEIQARSKKKDKNYVDFTQDLTRGEVLPDKALVYVVRPARLGFAIKSWFLCDDQVLGVNKGESYFFAYVEPGTHVLWSKSENVDALELELEAGETYYIQQKVQMGGLKARTKLEVLDEAEGERLLGKCSKHSTLTEAGRERGMEIAQEYRDRTEDDLERRATREAQNKEE